MNIIYRLFFITAFVIFSSVASAFTVPKDSLGTEANASEFEATLDSVLNLWYIEKSLNNTANKFSDIISTEKIPDFPDSVYIERLSKIPSIIPLSFNQEVKSYINVYTKKKRTSVEVMLGLMDYYFPMIEEIFDSYNLPLELRFLPVIESALNPRAVSRVGATGLWQFMYGTGRNYGLTVNSLVDERRDPINATRAAAKYVKDLYNIFHDWVLVIAAYNCGPGNVNKAIRRSGGKKNYWSIYYNLPRETRGYVPAFIAATYTMNYYKEHGLVPKIIDMPQATDTIMITDNLHLKQVAGVLNLPMEELRNLNPQYRYDIVPGKTLPCTLTLPFQYTSKFIDMQDSIFAYKDSLFFNPALKLMSPGHSYTPYRSRYTAEAKNSGREQERERIGYKVKKGETLGLIAQKYEVSVSDLKHWNKLRKNTVKYGQKLVVYLNHKKKEKDNDNNLVAEKRNLDKKSETVKGSDTAEVTKKDKKSRTAEASNFIYYKVKEGDTLSEIASRYPGNSDKELMELNNLQASDKIMPGQKLKIRKKG